MGASQVENAANSRWATVAEILVNENAICINSHIIRLSRQRKMGPFVFLNHIPSSGVATLIYPEPKLAIVDPKKGSLVSAREAL
jgi:hypothetical protein